MITPRQYQLDAVESVHAHVCTKDTNPCVVIPTAGGKSVVMAMLIAKWREGFPHVRGCILAHRKELVQQNADKLRLAGESHDIGVFSCGLGRKDYDSPILFASIDSIYKKSGEFPPFDFIFVDEAHRIPPAGEGKYRTYIAGCKRFNKQLRVVGFTATPFRMGCGPICHKDHILNEICYEAKIPDLLHQGYLCQLRSKVGTTQPDLSEVKANSNGDYILNSLAKATNKDEVILQAIAEAMRIITAENRRHIIFFCVDIEHCHKVSLALRRHGVTAPCVTGKTDKHERDRIIADFKCGRIHAVCNVNVLTEGFDAPHIDCIVLVRPTLSPGLFYQMVGRGMRLFSAKRDCLVLDFASCIDEHGPIDCLSDGPRTVMAVCGNCRESFSRATRRCPACGTELPKHEVDRLDQLERERRMHGDKASEKSILSQAETLKVDTVYLSRHCKPGSPDSLKVQYRCGLSMFREWVCLDHTGQAGQIAQDWWRRRFHNKEHVSVNDVLQNMFASQTLLEWTKTITVKKNGKYFEVTDYNKDTTT